MKMFLRFFFNKKWEEDTNRKTHNTNELNYKELLIKSKIISRMKSFVFGLTIIFNSARLVNIRLLEQSPRLLWATRNSEVFQGIFENNSNYLIIIKFWQKGIKLYNLFFNINSNSIDSTSEGKFNLSAISCDFVKIICFDQAQLFKLIKCSAIWTRS